MEKKINLKLTENPDVRELTLANGIAYPSDEELVMLILGRGTRNNPIRELSRQVVNTIASSRDENLLENLKKIEGMGESKSLAVCAALELGRRRRGYLKAVIEKPRDIIPYVQHYSMMHTEHFVTASVNGAHEILEIRLVSVGTTNKAIVHPREVFAEPLSEHASGIICCHNHPSGQCYPSSADMDTTRALLNASSILGIAFMDHIIITSNDYFSFLEHGLLN